LGKERKCWWGKNTPEMETHPKDGGEKKITYPPLGGQRQKTPRHKKINGSHRKKKQKGLGVREREKNKHKKGGGGKNFVGFFGSNTKKRCCGPTVPMKPKNLKKLERGVLPINKKSKHRKKKKSPPKKNKFFFFTKKNTETKKRWGRKGGLGLFETQGEKNFVMNPYL